MRHTIRYDWQAPAAFLAMSALLCLAALIFNLNPFLVLGGGAAALAFLYAAYRVPELFLVAVLFIPQLKAFWPLQPIDKIVDLTGVMLAGLAIGLSLRLLHRSAGLERWRPIGSLSGLKLPIILYFVFAAVVAASYFETSAPHYGGSKLLRFLGIGTLLFFSSFVLIREERDLRRVALLFVGCGMITAVQILAHLETRNAAAMGDEDITRIGAGWLMGMTIVLLLYFRFIERDYLHRTVVIIGLPLLVAGLVASVARGPMVALALVVPINFFLTLKSRKLGTSIAMILLAVVSTYGAFSVLLTVAPERTQAKLNELVRLAEGESGSGSAVKRIPFYKTALFAIPAHPLLGRGIGSWSVYYYGSDTRNYPHNMFLEVAFEEGLLGLGILWLFLAAVGDSSLHLLRVTGPRYAAFPSLVLFSVAVGMFSGDIDDDRMVWFWAGLTLAVCRVAARLVYEHQSMMPPVRRPVSVRVFDPTRPENRHTAIP